MIEKPGLTDGFGSFTLEGRLGVLQWACLVQWDNSKTMEASPRNSYMTIWHWHYTWYYKVWVLIWMALPLGDPIFSMRDSMQGLPCIIGTIHDFGLNHRSSMQKLS